MARSQQGGLTEPNRPLLTPNHLGAADRGYARPILRIQTVELPGGYPTRLTVIIPYGVQNVM